MFLEVLILILMIQKSKSLLNFMLDIKSNIAYFLELNFVYLCFLFYFISFLFLIQQYTNCYLNMKLQIVSKLILKSSHAKENTLSYSILPVNTYNQDQYPERYINKQKVIVNSSINVRDQFAEFFDKFEEACTVLYTKRVDKQENFRKRLQSQLISLQETQISNRKKSSIEFSFKKEDKSECNDKNTTLQTEASQSITRCREVYSIASTKGKLRKFNSLLTLKGQSQQNNNSCTSRPLVIKNTSVCKQSSLNYLKTQQEIFSMPCNRLSLNPSTSRIKVQSLEIKSPFIIQTHLKTQRCGEDIKQRLSRIRKQLNMIYQEKKQPQFKLKLY